MDKVLLDTDILSEVMRARNPAVLGQAQAYLAVFGRLTLSTVTIMEIIKGFHKLERHDAVRRFLEGLPSSEVLDFTMPAAVIAGRIYGDLERAGQPIGRADPMIAAIAIQHNLSLATGNIEHYQRIQKLGYHLRTENWR